MNYFKDCQTIEDIKKLYKTLVMQNHPDRGGNTAIMQTINSDYAFACAKMFSNSGMNDIDINSSILDSEAYKAAVNKVAGLEGITIELVGTWVWITGNTKQYAAILKSADGGKFTWAKKKTDFSAWFFRTSEYKFSNRGTNKSLEEIKEKYGSQTINSHVPRLV